MDKKLIYFPSFSAGAFGNGAKKNELLKNGSTCRFYDKAFPEKFRHPYFLWPAGHFYKQQNINQEWGFVDNPDVLLFGDSGGYQIASGAIKWSDEIRDKILVWLDENSNIAMNLDIPPRLKYEGKFEECLEISTKNIKFFHENRKNPKVKFLNVIQGNNEYTYNQWYQEVKKYEFEGWSIGGCGGSLYRFLSGLMVFLNNKEHLNPNNEYLHILGTSKIIDFLILSQLQKSINDVGSKLQVTTDSSSPNRATVFGTVYHGYDLKDCSFKSLHLPKSTIDHGRDRSKDGKNTLILGNGEFHLPILNEFHEWLKDGYEYDDIKSWNSLGYIASVLHNFYLFKDALREIEYYIYGEPYVLQQVLNSDSFKLLNLVDEMVKSESPEKVFQKNKQFILQINSKYSDLNLKMNTEVESFF